MNIYKCLRIIWPDKRPGQQEDAHEFLTYLLQSLDDRCFFIGTYLERSRFVFFNKNEDQAVFSKIFGGKTRSQVQCLECKNVSNTFENFKCLSLDLPEIHQQQSSKERNCSKSRLSKDNLPVVDLQTLVNKYFGTEMLTDAN